MSTMTSMYPSQHGVYHPNRDVMLADGIPTLAGMLRENGFMTHSFFTHKRLVPNYGFSKGFDAHNHRQCDKIHNRGTADEVTMKVQQRGYTSPIWYTP